MRSIEQSEDGYVVRGIVRCDTPGCEARAEGAWLEPHCRVSELFAPENLPDGWSIDWPDRRGTTFLHDADVVVHCPEHPAGPKLQAVKCDRCDGSGLDPFGTIARPCEVCHGDRVIAREVRQLPQDVPSGLYGPGVRQCPACNGRGKLEYLAGATVYACPRCTGLGSVPSVPPAGQPADPGAAAWSQEACGPF